MNRPSPFPRRAEQADAFDPELRGARLLPRTVISPHTLSLIRGLTGFAGRRQPTGATITRIDANVSVRMFRPPSSQHPVPGLLFIHGGGYVMGTAAMGDHFCRRAADHVGVVAASVEYRLAPEHPFPTPLEDCYMALRWLARQPEVNAGRIAVAGESAGGGLAAALAVLARQRGEVRPVLQVLSYPMLDDRTTNRIDIDTHGLRMWSPANNRFGWRAYLGPTANGAVPPLAAPARNPDLSGLPRAWIGVGTNDLFHDEDVDYARRLEQAGVPTTLHIVPGAYHGFDLIHRGAPPSRAFFQARLAALAGALAHHDPIEPPTY